MTRMSPQQKKALSLKRDRRNDYGENAKASRKAIPLKKRRQARAERRLAQTAVPAGASAVDLERLDEVEVRLVRVRREGSPRLKVPDKPLGEVLARKLVRRARLGMVDPKAAASPASHAQQAANLRRRRAS